MDSNYVNISQNGAVNQQAGSKRLNIFYYSDYHGNVPAYRRLTTVSDTFDKKNKGEETLKLSGGDLVSDPDTKKRIFLYRLLNKMKLDASAVGNHEWDGSTNFYKETDKLFKKAPNLLFNNFISCNIKAKDDDDKHEYEKEGLFQSKIINKGGNKYGLIGATTPDYRYEGSKNDDLLKVGEDLSEEIQKLKKQDPSLNRFIFLSHLGKKADQVIAQTVPDIDVIIGGHSHDTIEGIVKGENLFNSPKNEPVLIVQAGNEKTFGELSLEFDKDGKIDLSKGHEPVNKTDSIENYPENPEVKKLENEVFGKDIFVGNLAQEIKPGGRATENLLGNLATDALIWKTGADIALMNAGTFRASLQAGQINKRDIEYCVPFQNEAMTIKMKGKDIAELIKYGVESTKNEHVDPGLFQVGGMKYTVTPDKKLVNLYTVDKNGKKQQEIIDAQGNLSNNSAEKDFTVALTDHVVTRFFPRLKLSQDYTYKDDDKIKVDKKQIVNKYSKDRDILTEYLQTEFTSKNKPIEPESGRITVQNNPSFKNVSGFGFASLIKQYTKN
jgi:5'-nucleotidase